MIVADRSFIATVVLAAVMLWIPGSAAAHVRVHPDSTASGSSSALTFRVPNESGTAAALSLVVGVLNGRRQAAR